MALLQKIVERFGGGSELANPWPRDVLLIQPYEAEQILLPDNANCLAVKAYLKMCKLNYTVVHYSNAEAMSPSAKVPFLKIGKRIESEMAGIVTYVNAKGLSNLTDHLTDESKADLCIYMGLISNVLEMAELYICWCDRDTYNEVTAPRYGSIFPWPLNSIQTRTKRNSVIKKLKAMDWYEKTMEQVIEQVEKCCQALSDRLEGRTFFFDEQPTELDALVFGHIFTILTTPLSKNSLAETVRNYPVLINLVTNLEQMYFGKDLSSRSVQ